MNILGLSNKYSGCGYHRILLPLGFMDGIKGYVTNWVTEDKAEGWDILLYNRLSAYDLDWNKTKELLGVKVILDMDDSWHLPPNHMNYHEYELISERIESNIRQADMVTVTNNILADKVRPINQNVHIFENALPYGRNQFTDERQPDDRVRIFWCGGVSHEHDLALLSNPIKRLSVYSDKIKMVIGGYNDSDEGTRQTWHKIFSHFTAGGQLPHAKLHAVPPTSYMQMYEYADIMVIPLEDTEWHSCKSNLKIIEAACKKIPCIVSNVPPYNLDADCPVRWVNNKKDWFEHLKYLILHAEERIKEGQLLYEWATKKYNLTDVNAKRKRAFEHLCGV